MLGWTLVFGLMSLPGAAAIVTGYGAATSIKTTTVVFALLFFVFLAAHLIRRRVR
jgi:hypothetical protein